MVPILNFAPQSSYVINATTSSSNTALTQPTSLPNPSGAAVGGLPGYTDVVVYNAAAKVAYLSFGMSSQTATASSLYQVPPGAVMGFSLPGPMTNCGCILESGASAANVYLMLGSGS